MPYPPGESSAFARSVSVAAASLAEHRAQGMDTLRSPTIKISASGVVSRRLAVIGSVFLIFRSAKKVVPGLYDQVKVLEDDFPDFTLRPRRQIVGPRFVNCAQWSQKPKLAFCFSFPRVYMNRLVTFVRIEEEPPSTFPDYGRHRLTESIWAQPPVTATAKSLDIFDRLWH